MKQKLKKMILPVVIIIAMASMTINLSAQDVPSPNPEQPGWIKVVTIVLGLLVTGLGTVAPKLWKKIKEGFGSVISFVIDKTQDTTNLLIQVVEVSAKIEALENAIKVLILDDNVNKEQKLIEINRLIQEVKKEAQDIPPAVKELLSKTNEAAKVAKFI